MQATFYSYDNISLLNCFLCDNEGYKQKEVKYIGFKFSKDGRAVDEERVRALVPIKSPQKKSLQRCMGMFNYIRDFIPNMSSLTAPLRQLLKDDVLYQWLPKHEHVFNELKPLVANTPTLVNFDPSKPIEIQCDASKDDMGCVLLQENRRVAFASASLTQAEQNYSQCEKELRAIDFSLRKFHNYIYGYDVTIKTDHKPLVPLMYKSVHKIGSSVLQRLRLRLFKYRKTVEYLPGKNMYIADILSRSYLNEHSDDVELKEIVHSIVKHLPMSETWKQKYLEETSKDSELNALKQFFQNGWPDHKNKVNVLNRSTPYGVEKQRRLLESESESTLSDDTHPLDP